MKSFPNKKYRRIIDDLDEHMSYLEPAAHAAAVLVAAANVGTDPRDICRETELPLHVCEKLCEQAIDGGVFTADGKVAHSGWFDAEDGGIAFWLDVNIVQGFMRRIAA